MQEEKQQQQQVASLPHDGGERSGKKRKVKKNESHRVKAREYREAMKELYPLDNCPGILLSNLKT